MVATKSLYVKIFLNIFAAMCNKCIYAKNEVEGKRPLGRPRLRWEDNIKMDLQEVGGGCRDWMELAEDRDRWRALVRTVVNFQVPKMRRIS
jgi:hypothetical protein